MSVWLASTVGAAYATGVIGLHRFNVWRQRSAARGFPTLGWVDWSALLSGLLPPSGPGASKAPQPVEGGPPTTLLDHEPSPEAKPRHALLCALVTGHRLDEAAFEAGGFSGGEAHWLSTLSRIREQPEEVLDLLDAAPSLDTSAQLYLREHLFLTQRVHPLNLELAVFSSKRRLLVALERFPDVPALHFVRAHASALLGFTRAVLDDLGRAVYFSRQAPFYLPRRGGHAVDRGGPAGLLLHQCRAALAEAAKLG